jgi:hypothetical protein
MTYGKCECNNEVIGFISEFIVRSFEEMGKVLQSVMCPALLALDLIVEVGSAAIPGVGKAITVGMSKCDSISTFTMCVSG